MEDVDALTTAAQGVEAVFHLGDALTSRGNSDEEFFEFNLRGTFNLLMAVRDHAPAIQRFAYASSDAVYWSGSTAGAFYLPVDEVHHIHTVLEFVVHLSTLIGGLVRARNGCIRSAIEVNKTVGGKGLSRE